LVVEGPQPMEGNLIFFVTNVMLIVGEVTGWVCEILSYRLNFERSFFYLNSCNAFVIGELSGWMCGTTRG
jgi:hypothetical protein